MIGVLGAALIGVLVFGQDGGAAAVNDAATTEPRARRRAADPAVKSKATVWPKVSLEEMLAHNPFAQPNLPKETEPKIPAPEEVAAAEAKTLESAKAKSLEVERQTKVDAVMTDWRNQKVNMILRTDRGVTALIGDRKVREGQIIDGVRIVSIRPNGVIVEPVSSAKP
ncbi:MAG: hypothetical protein JWM11_3858 [Planctomycetaceae bacterium]|nr:hypothetical protein [Planctomycetaceae bacterium]